MKPAVLLFDVNETLSDLAPLAAEFAASGAPPELARTWFASVLRDGMAIAATGDIARFADLAADQVRVLLAPHVADVAEAVDRVMAAFLALPVHPDVAPGLNALRDNGFRLFTFSNGAPGVARSLLERAGVDGVVEDFLSVEQAGAFKPLAPAYRWAARRAGVAEAEAMLVAVHPWDTHGASRAGLRSAWIDRDGGTHFPGVFARPDVVAGSLVDLAGLLGGSPG